jgi:2-polyprenyl-3-methyl-5-hydroxy-6-metoxy-1,4-benzoquinol methylase
MNDHMNDHSDDHSDDHSHVYEHAERFVPEEMGGRLIEAEHQARYRIALGLVGGGRVLDAGCGVGWGSELLRSAGAGSVVGLDIAEEALEDARKRAPECAFVRGDLQELPFGEGSFDVIVCMEALEHVDDTGRALDQLARVLDPDGVLLVSSPNPGVYEPGNPFHQHEQTAEELEQELALRFPHTRLMRQYRLMASTVVADVDRGRLHATLPLEALSVSPLASGTETYSVMVASHAELPEVPPFVALAPATELAELVSERADMLAQLEATHAQLRDADAAIRSVMTTRDEAFQQAADLQTRWQATDVQLRNLRQALENAARERDDVTLRLVLLEQELAGTGRPGGTVPRSELVAAERRAEELRAILRRRRGKTRRLRTSLQQLEQEAERARTDAEEARAALAAGASVPRRAARWLRSLRRPPTS